MIGKGVTVIGYDKVNDLKIENASEDTRRHASDLISSSVTIAE